MAAINRPGLIRCGKIERGVHHPSIPGFLKINASSMGPIVWKGLSPMLLGPFNVTEPYDGELRPGFTIKDDDPTTQIAFVKRFENYWQGSKLYNVDIDENRHIKPSFFERRAIMFSSDKGKRRALPKAKYGIPIAGFYNGVVMGYVESRKKIYCPYYEQLVTRIDEYNKLACEACRHGYLL